MLERCTPRLPSPVGDFTYRFRVYPVGGVTLREGKYTERDESGGIEWEVSVTQQDPISLAAVPARLLLLFFNHISGSGSAAQVMVMRCHRGHLQVIFEAGGEGLGCSYSVDKGLWVGHAVWRGNDSHASPSGGIDEMYRWQPKREMFTRVWRSEW